MIDIAYDPTSLSLVIVESKPVSTDADLEGAVAAVTKLGHESNAAGRVGTFVMIVDDGVPAPSAAWRRRFAEAEAVFQRLDMWFVTRSALARGVITAVRWLAGERAGVFHETQETFEAALRSCEKRAGKPMPQLVKLHDACRSAAAERGRRAS